MGVVVVVVGVVVVEAVAATVGVADDGVEAEGEATTC